MSTVPLVINHTIKVEGDIYVVGNSQTTTSTDCFNVVTAKGTFIGNAKTASPEPTLNVPHASSANDADVHSSRNLPHDQTGEAEIPSRRTSTSTSSSINVENTYPPAPRFNAQFQCTPHHYSKLSSDSLDAQESPRNSTGTSPTMENLRQYILCKIKWWFDKLFGRLFMTHL